jgi:DNA-binding NarL/FixJ family response regulator
VTIRVVVADDQPLVRSGLAGILATAMDIEVVALACDGREAVELVARHDPDVVLMDIRMPGVDGIEATRLVTGSSKARVLVLTTFDLDEYVYGALQNGASGFLLKDAAPEELLHAVRVVAAGDALLAPRVTRRLLSRFAGRGSDEPLGITEREREVLLLVAEGLSNAEIGERLHITPGTAKTHVARLLMKLEARDRVQLVVFAHRQGLVGVS